MDSDRYKIKKSYDEIYGQNNIPITVKNLKIMEDYYIGKQLIKLEVQNIGQEIISNVKILIEFIDNQDIVKNSYEKELTNLKLTLNQFEEVEVDINSDENNKIKITIKEICFENKNKINDVVLEKMDLDCALSTFDGLEEQYKREVKKLSSKCNSITNRYVEKDNIWKCVCGNIYFKNVDECLMCNIKKDDLIKLEDSKFLRERKNEFDQQKNEKVEENKRRNRKFLIVSIIVLIICLSIILIVINIKNSDKYEEANELMNQKKYLQAKDVFEELSGYKDSKSKLNECEIKIEEERKRKEDEENEKIYLQAMEDLENGKFDSACNKFETILEYKDSEKMCEESEIYYYIKNLGKGDITSRFSGYKYRSEVINDEETLKQIFVGNWYERGLLDYEFKSFESYTYIELYADGTGIKPNSTSGYDKVTWKIANNKLYFDSIRGEEIDISKKSIYKYEVRKLLDGVYLLIDCSDTDYLGYIYAIMISENSKCAERLRKAYQ